MSDFRNRNQNGALIGTVTVIGVGIVIFICPGTILLTLCRIAGFLMLLIGIIQLVIQIKNHCCRSR